MSLFSLGKGKMGIVTLIDIGSASVGGAYVRYQAGKKPFVCYTARVDIAPRNDESVADSMLRSLSFLERLLAEEGGPELRRMFGDVSMERIVVSIAGPWQGTEVTTTHIEEKHPFVFTRDHVEKAAHKAPMPEGHVLSGQSVIATYLNGYQVAKPFGKRTTRAELVVLSSSVDRDVTDSVRASLRRAFHTSDIRITAFAPSAYEAFQAIYPHQKDLIVVDVSGGATDMLIVKHGVLAQAASIPTGTHDLTNAIQETGSLLDRSADTAESAWLENLRDVFARFAAERALPSTLFLLADANAREYLKRTVEKSAIQSLWHAEEPLRIVTITSGHLSDHVKTSGTFDQDLFLSILVLSSVEKVS